jgi:CheY-like chemotaxis protein
MGSVLLVEDSPDNAAVYRTMLEFLGHVVMEAGDGETGVRLATESCPDLIIMDMGIPKLNGWDATRMLKADPRTAHIPIVALTAYALPGDEEMCRAAGCDEYMSKPASPQAVGALVQRLVGPPTPDDPPPNLSRS